jgi:hypothetical protein
MRNVLLMVALALLVAIPADAAIQYEFMQTNTSDDSVSPSSDLTARATVEGAATKVEFLSGTIYPPGTYVLTTDGFQRLYFVDPSKQWYTEVNAAGIASALGAAGISIKNFKAQTETLPDRPVIAGAETEHQRVTLTYEISVTMKAIPLTQQVRTEIDVWTTQKFGPLRNEFLYRGLRTGDPDLDKILDAEVARVPGFPMRQLVTTRTKYDLPIRSNLNAPTTRTITREMWVTAIRETQIPATTFVLPATYRRADQPELPKAATQVLTFEPEGSE